MPAASKNLAIRYSLEEKNTNFDEQGGYHVYWTNNNWKQRHEWWNEHKYIGEFLLDIFPIFFKTNCQHTKKIVGRELVVIPDLDYEFGRDSLFSFVQAPEMTL